MTAAAKLMPELKLIPGFALDLTTVEERGRPWNFDQKVMRDEALRRVREEKPLLLIGSPMCTAFSTWQRINDKIRDSAVCAAEKARAVEHLKFSVRLYREQLRNGRYFLHEHPAATTSWKLPVVTQFRARYPHLYAVTMNMCQFGMATPNSRGKLTPAKKPTR